MRQLGVVSEQTGEIVGCGVLENIQNLPHTPIMLSMNTPSTKGESHSSFSYLLKNILSREVAGRLLLTHGPSHSLLDQSRSANKNTYEK